jgi:hypothetical protein
LVAAHVHPLDTGAPIYHRPIAAIGMIVDVYMGVPSVRWCGMRSLQRIVTNVFSYAGLLQRVIMISLGTFRLVVVGKLGL